MKKIELVIFDMDGLIIDSERVFLRCAKRALYELGYHVDRSFLIEQIGIDWALAEKMCRERLTGLDYDAYMDKLQEVTLAYLEAHPYKKKKGFTKLMRYLKKNGIKTAIATSTHRDYAHRRMDGAGVRDMFDCIIYGDDISRGKPSPDIYKKVLERMNVPADNALVLEDSKNGLLSAVNAGIRCVVVPDVCYIPEHVLEKAYDVVGDLGCVIDVIEQ